jgi:hypothetical protein
MRWLDLLFSWSRGRSFADGTTGAPVRQTLTGREIVALLSTHHEAESKHAVFYFSPGLQPEGGKRRKSTGYDAQIFAFDFDGKDGRGESNRWIALTLQELDRRGIAYVAYTSHSHGSKAAPGRSRFRIVLFASQPVKDAAEYAGVWRGWAAFFDHKCDPAPKAINAVFYPPTVLPGETRKWARVGLGDRAEQARGSGAGARTPLFNPKRFYEDAPAKEYEPVAFDPSVPTDLRIRAALAVLETLEPRLKNHAHTAAVRAGLLGSDFGVPWLEWREAIVSSAWNQRCAPPYAPSELEEHAGSRLYESAERPFGWRWKTKPDVNASNGIHIPDIGGNVDRDKLVKTIASLAERYPDGAIVLVRAPVSAGKTEGISRLAARFETVKVVSPTVALGRDLCERLSAKWHDGNRDAKRMVSTMASSPKYKRKRHLFVMDEAPRCLETLASGITRDKEKAWQGLRADLRDSALAVLASADLSMAHYQWLLRIAGDRPIVVVGADGQILRPDIRLRSVRSALRTFLDLVATQKDGCRMLGCDAQSDVEEYAQAARLTNPELEVLEIHGHSDRRNLKEKIEAANVIVFNAAAGDGLNIEREILDITGIHTMRERGGEAVLQQLARARNVKNPVVVVGCSRFTYSNRRPIIMEEIRKAREERERVLVAAADELGIEHERVDVPELDELCDLVQLDRNVAWCDPMQSLQAAGARYGWEITYEIDPLDEKGNDPDPGPDRAIIAQAKNDVKRRLIEGLCAARDLSEEEYEEIRRKRDRTTEDRYLIGRYKTRQTFGARVFDSEPALLLERDYKGRYRRGVTVLALALLWKERPEIVLSHDVGGRRHQSQITARAFDAELLNSVCDMLGAAAGESIVLSTQDMGKCLEALQASEMASLIRMCGRKVPTTWQGACQFIKAVFRSASYTSECRKTANTRIYTVTLTAPSVLHVEAVKERIIADHDRPKGPSIQDTLRTVFAAVRGVPALLELHDE